ncbi:MAG: winged helix-turn-helix domain-containing protein [Actinomycetota bacterium]
MIQIDSVNVLVRSQELPLFSRLGDHPRSLIPDATDDSELFEYWCHEASHLPLSMHPLMRWRMDQARRGEMWGGLVRAARENPKLLDEIRDRVQNDGPIVAGDVKTRTGPKGSWWDWDTGKALLEYLFWAGEITARRRPNDFARMYFALDDALPSHVVNAKVPSEPDARRALVLLAARSLGVGTAGDLADYHRQTPTQIKPMLADLVREGELEAVRVEGWKDQAYKLPDSVMPRRVEARALLSPFDSLVWCRPRIERLFGFHYRIEIYTPKPKRRFGYYVLPVLCGERLVGRLDMKADRHAGVLRVEGAYLERGVAAKSVAAPIAARLREMASWLGLDDVAVARRGSLATPLVALCK